MKKVLAVCLLSLLSLSATSIPNSGIITTCSCKVATETIYNDPEPGEMYFILVAMGQSYFGCEVTSTYTGEVIEEFPLFSICPE